MSVGGGGVCVCVWKRALSAVAELHSCQRDPQAGLWSDAQHMEKGFLQKSLPDPGRGPGAGTESLPCGLHLAQHQQRVSRRLGMLSILAQQRARLGLDLQNTT